MSAAMSRRGPGAVKPRRPGARDAVRAALRRGEHAPDRLGPRAVGCVVLTVSDTRRGDDDQGGALIASLLTRAGHVLVARAWVRDNVAAIRRAARAALARRGCDVVIVTGGTGMSPRDVTPEALAPLMTRPLPGFGELFRMRSWDQVGPAAWFSRAAAGVARGKLLVMLPGSMKAVELAMNDLLLPELVHAVRTLGRFQP